MNTKSKQKLICATLLIIGTGLCIGGVFVPILLAVGGIVLAGAFGIFTNIVEDKDRITVNNNYSNYSFPGKEPNSDSNRKPLLREVITPKIKSFFGFNNKKFMKHHENLENVKSSPHIIEEHESNGIQIPEDMLQEINKLNDILSKINIEAISKVAQQYEEKSHLNEHDNNRQ